MKRPDLWSIAFLILLFAPFMLSTTLYSAYEQFNREHGMVMSFVKFAILATFGEMLALRIRKGVYNEPGFGLLPRAIVWGFLGLTIKLAFTVFGSGVPVFLEYIGINGAGPALKGSFSSLKLFTAFSVSAAMNSIFAPVMMTFHKITDTHILKHGGTMAGFLKPVEFGSILKNMNWEVMWNFVFKKTIPFFWIPAHTITFLLPPEFQVLFAALLGIALGLLLAIAGLKGQKI